MALTKKKKNERKEIKPRKKEPNIYRMRNHELLDKK